MPVDLYLAPPQGSPTDLYLYPDGPHGPAYEPVVYNRDATLQLTAPIIDALAVSAFVRQVTDACAPPTDTTSRGTTHARAASETATTPVDVALRLVSTTRDAALMLPAPDASALRTVALQRIADDTSPAPTGNALRAVALNRTGTEALTLTVTTQQGLHVVRDAYVSAANPQDTATRAADTARHAHEVVDSTTALASRVMAYLRALDDQAPTPVDVAQVSMARYFERDASTGMAVPDLTAARVLSLQQLAATLVSSSDATGLIQLEYVRIADEPLAGHTVGADRQVGYSREAVEQTMFTVTAFLQLLSQRRPVRLWVAVDKRATLATQLHEALR